MKFIGDYLYINEDRIYSIPPMFLTDFESTDITEINVFAKVEKSGCIIWLIH
jgi:hypothetical protein